MPANVYDYAPGFNRASSRLLMNLLKARDGEGYVKDVAPQLTNWVAESKKGTICFYS